jgi:hypothetical protein
MVDIDRGEQETIYSSDFTASFSVSGISVRCISKITFMGLGTAWQVSTLESEWRLKSSKSLEIVY